MPPEKDPQNPTAEEPEDNVEEDTDEPEEGGEPEGTEPEWTPPTREQWDATQAKLTRARQQAQKLREGKRAEPTPAAPDSQAAATAAADVEKWQQRAVSTAAKAELLTRGADPDMVELALGRLKVSAIEFGDDDQPDLEDWLDEIQDRYPKLFKQPEQPAAPARTKTGRVETPAGKAVRPKMSLGEQIIANSQGLGRRR
jgi:hypothetical protein